MPARADQQQPDDHDDEAGEDPTTDEVSRADGREQDRQDAHRGTSAIDSTSTLTPER